MELFKTDFKCAQCGQKVSTSKDYVKIVFIKKDKQGKHKFRFCSTSCMEQWLISHTSVDKPVEVYSLEEGIKEEKNDEERAIEEKENVDEEIIKEKNKAAEGTNYNINNEYTLYNNTHNEKQENIMIDPVGDKLKALDEEKEHHFEYDGIKQRIKYHNRPRNFFEKIKEKLKITMMINYEED